MAGLQRIGPMAVSRPEPDGNTYWYSKYYFNIQVEKETIVESAGYKIPKAKNPQEAVDLEPILRRIECQLPNYNRCDVKELRKFARDRKIEFEEKRPGKKKLVPLLEAADEQRTFSRFMDLSAELRCMIYECYMEDFPEKLETPIQPPLAKVCRQVRAEFVPLFYQTMNFQLVLRSGMTCSAEKTLTFSSKTTDWLDSLSPANLGDLRNTTWDIQVNPLGPNISGSPEWVEIEAQVRVKKGEQATLTEVSTEKTYWHHDGHADRLFDGINMTIDRTLGEFAKEQASKDGKMEIHDLYKVRRKLEKAVYKVDRWGRS